MFELINILKCASSIDYYEPMKYSNESDIHLVRSLFIYRLNKFFFKNSKDKFQITAYVIF
jgi:hypothetical protein